MKIYYIFFTLTCLFASVSFTAQAQEINNKGSRSLSLEEAISIALQNNEQIKTAQLEVPKSKARVDELIATGMPQVNASVAFNANPIPQSSLVSGAGFARLGNPNAKINADSIPDIKFTVQQTYDGNAGIRLSQLVFDGSYFVGLKAAKVYKELSVKNVEKTEIDITESVMKAYYNVLINTQRITVLENNFSRLDSLLKETQIMFQNGYVGKIDVDRIRLSFNNIRVELNKFKKLNELGYKLLNFQMGIDLNEPIILTDKLEYVSLDVPSTESDIFYYDKRIEYSILQTNKTLSNLNSIRLKSQYLPVVNIAGYYGFNTATSNISQYYRADRWLSSGTIGIHITMPIFDGSARVFRVQQSKIESQQIEHQMSLTKKKIDLEIEQAKNLIEYSLENLEIQKQNRELSQEIYNTTKLKYEQGVGSNLELTEADAAFKQAQVVYYSALYDVIIAKIELEKSLGILRKQK
ncbi:MAG: TolC family protein [Chitinophagaceae bacterium]|nr:TolC family protein [Chitinophagaceae bacterium]